MRNRNDCEPREKTLLRHVAVNELCRGGRDPVDGEPRKWTLARYSLPAPNVLRLEAADHDAFEKATTAEQRAKVLAAGLKSGQLFGDFCVCIRAAKK